MTLSEIKIVADSSGDLLTLRGTDFAAAPLKIITDHREFVDDCHLDVAEMTGFLAAYHGRSSTACPGPGDWLTAFDHAQYVFCVTITSNLSGSYNAACAAREQYLQEHPDRQVYVLDSLSVGPEMQLILEHFRDRILAGDSFEAACAAAEHYRRSTGLMFMLSSMRNLANNGRVSPLLAKAAGLLGIRAIGKASDQGTLEMLDKCRGEKKALQTVTNHLHTLGYQGGAVHIGHCGNEDAARALEALLRQDHPDAAVTIYPCRGLCSFYAEPGGLLIGFEKG